VKPRARDRALGTTLDAFLATFDFSAARARDPVAFAHRFEGEADREVVALFAALLAYGRVDLIARALEDVTTRMGPNPAAAARADDLDAARRRFDGFVYRFTRGEDLARLWFGVGRTLSTYGGLGACAVALDRPDAPDLRVALTGLRTALVAPTLHLPSRRGFDHLVADPERASACKRWFLYLRWMVRGPDAVDLGQWRALGTHRLLMPVDTHIHRISTYLGLTTRAGADARTSREITDALLRLDPDDPVRFDFALTHMGISGGCLRRREASVCTACPIESVCRLDATGRVRSTAVKRP
jgi:uncharacterized protein (TIGR02757 family)